MPNTGLISSHQTRPSISQEYYIRKNEPIEPPTNMNIQSLISGGSGNIAYNNTLNLTPGKYMIQLSAETSISATNTRLHIYVAGPQGPTRIVSFSNAHIKADVGLAEFSLSTNIFTITTPGTYRIFVVSMGINTLLPGNNWTAKKWNLQLISIN